MSEEMARNIVSTWVKTNGLNDWLVSHEHFEKMQSLCDLVATCLQAAPSRKLELETLIAGHMEAMRPLLDEWSSLTNKNT